MLRALALPTLENGQSPIEIDAVFAETVNLDEPYHVFVQAYGDAELYVADRSAASFQLIAKAGSSDRNTEFSYRIVGRRNGSEHERLEPAPWVSAEQPYYQPRDLPPDMPELELPAEGGG